MKKACVIGWPISHSRSPLIHNYWLKQYGISGRYDRVAVKPEELQDFMATLIANGLEGCNVTIPHKEAAFKLVTPADETTRRLGVVNTVFHHDGNLFGTSTDGEGFLNNAIQTVPELALANSCITILGAGGAAMAIIGALLDAGCGEIRLLNRTRERAELLRTKFSQRIVPIDWERRDNALQDCDLLVNTTALGMTGQQPLQINLAKLNETAVVADIVYSPLETDLLRQARERGNRTVGGLGMLLHQAVRGFELWFGIRPRVTKELYDIVAADVMMGSRP